MVMASLAADSLALGVHWIYDAGKIKRDFGTVDCLLAPKQDSYHGTKSKGEFTHYGDQEMVMLESIAASGGFDLDTFFREWKQLFSGYDGYHDMATKTVLKNIQHGKGPDACGSASGDIAVVSRIAPLFQIFGGDRDGLLQAVRAQTLMTHTEPATVDVAEFFALLVLECLKGISPSRAASELAEGRFKESPIAGWTRQGLQARDKDSIPEIIKFGQSCHTSDAFPGIIQLIARYEDDLAQGVIQAVMAGGDNAARAGITAMVLAARGGLDTKTREWFEGLAKKEEIIRLLVKVA